jgi:tRNA (guanosine-2'-O-)-methyltransferase
MVKLLDLPEYISIGENSIHFQNVIDTLSPFINLERQKRIKNVIKNRQTGIVPVLDEIHDEANLTAVTRTAEAFGLQSILVFNNVLLKTNRKVSRGADKWLTINHYHRSHKKQVMEALKQENYQVVATGLGTEAISPQEVPMDRKTLLVMGNEKSGVSNEIMELADYTVKIPMKGFSQSLNISVAAGIIFSQILSRNPTFECNNDRNKLSQEQHNRLYAQFLLKAIQGSEKLIAHQIQKL